MVKLDPSYFSPVTPSLDNKEGEDLKTKVRSLQLELDSKVHETQVLTKSLERLRNEKLQHLKNGDFEYSEKGKLEYFRHRMVPKVCNESSLKYY